MKQAVAIVQARMSSKRLPGKAMLPLVEKPVIWHIHDRLRRCKWVNRTVIATSTDASDDVLADYCMAEGIEVTRGDLDDVLSRYVNVIKDQKYDYVVRVTGDTPLVHPPYIDRQIYALREFDGDWVWCDPYSDVLGGQGVLSTRAILSADAKSVNPADREHVGSVYFDEHAQDFRVVEMRLPERLVLDGCRFTLDEEPDYEFFEQVYKALWPASKYIDVEQALAWLREHPEVMQIHAHLVHKALNRHLRERQGHQAAQVKVGIFEYDNSYIQTN